MVRERPRPANVIPAKAGTQSSLGLRYVCGGMGGASPAFNQSAVRVCLGDLGSRLRGNDAKGDGRRPAPSMQSMAPL
jgi:hypothetical protein